jgi:hypothetical protein
MARSCYERVADTALTFVEALSGRWSGVISNASEEINKSILP